MNTYTNKNWTVEDHGHCVKTLNKGVEWDVTFDSMEVSVARVDRKVAQNEFIASMVEKHGIEFEMEAYNGYLASSDHSVIIRDLPDCFK